MIRRVFSSLGSFKELHFNEGLNILVSDKTEASTQRQTRNRAGKTSLIELMHFLLGGKCDKESIFRNNALIDESFGMILDLGGQPITVLRSGKKPSEIRVSLDFNFDTWPHKPSTKGTISNEDWREVLAQLTFDIPSDNDWGKWSPKYRQLISYFIRKQEGGGFVSPFKQGSQQAEGDSQVALSFLLGLDWTVSQQWQLVRDRERMLREIKKSANTEDLGLIVGDPAELRTQLAVAEQRVGRMREHVQTFNVVPEYRELETEANKLTAELAVLSDENTIDRGLASELDAAIETARIPSYADLEELYREVSVQLPDLALKQFEELEEFHRSITENRRAYLQGELDEARRRIEAREQKKARVDERRRELMSILRVGGALDQYVRLQSELTTLEQHTASLRSKLETAEYLQGQQAELAIERTRLRLRLQQDLREQKTRVDEAITTFEDVSSKLYEKAGSLIISDHQDGPKFDVRIQGQKSKGVSSMQVFCFDVTLMRLTIERGINPGFLVHDSHLFDGVDPRQSLTALQVGADMSSMFGFQYIVALNSDTLTGETGPDGFDAWKYVNKVRLTDATDDGGLFGIRFD
jgi:uncharacterized protein YydD (DUF2326 family)